MRRHLFISFLILSCGMMAQNSYYDIKKGTLYFKVLSDEEKTMQLVNATEARGMIPYTGTINIPEIVTLYGTDFTVVASETGTCNDNKNISKVVFPKTFRTIGGFYRCSSLKVFEVDEENPYFEVIDGIIYDREIKAMVRIPGGLSQETLYIPEGITKINSGTFRNFNGISNLILPSTIEYIGDNAFYNAKMNSVSFNNPVHEVQINQGFRSCRINKIVLPDNITEFPDYSFASAFIHEMKMPSNLKKIGRCAFLDSNLYFSIIIPDNVESIGNDAFNEAYLEGLYLPANVVLENNQVFNGITCYGDITIEEGRENIDYFFQYSDLDGATVSLPQSLTSARKTFYQCYLHSLSMPDNLKDISGILAGSGVIRSVKMPQYVENIDGAFEGDKRLLPFTIPETVTSIGYRTFYQNWEMKNMTLPEQLKNIGSQAFYDCRKLEEIEIPETVETIDKQAFMKCSLLNKVSFRGPVTLNEKAFSECTSLATVESWALEPQPFDDSAFDQNCYKYSHLTVPIGYAEVYRNTPGWSNFLNIEDSVDGIETPEVEEIDNVVIYDINGNKLNTTKRGINIIKKNGKTEKMLFK